MSQWSYAPTNRATCKGQCKEKIAKGEIRLGSEIDMGGHTSMTYRCLKCVTVKQIANMKEKFESLDKVEGFATLSEDDQAKVLAQEGEAAKLQEAAAKVKAAQAAAKAEAKKKAAADAKAEKAAAKAAAKGDPPAKRARVA
eukprot:TRINITY_DN2812_c0_g1_i1.p1 TRINITY_DN2812_c0_g1~~TRINITY_DN2812_c0_g1_i1.p1  ORF type:complete len:141 (-),score=40.09 TRINITY_DN2812_c0_g1_i1:54-476(-)